MKFIEKDDTRRLLSGEVSVANEAYGDIFPLAIRSLAEKLVRSFTEEFDHEPHSSWFSKAETTESALNLTRIEMRITFPTEGDEIMVEDKRIMPGFTVTEHTRLPVLKPTLGWVSDEEHPNPHTGRTDAYRHIGWDADTGLMVFGRKS